MQTFALLLHQNIDFGPPLNKNNYNITYKQEGSL